jgi:hypothetical protein
MIVLQIIMIPCVVLLMIIGIFVIGSTGIENVGYPTQSDQTLSRVNKPDPTLINTQLYLSLGSRCTTKPKKVRLMKTQNDNTEINLPDEPLADLSTIISIR